MDAIESGSIAFTDAHERIGSINIQLAKIERDYDDTKLAAIPPMPIEKWNIPALREEILDLLKSDNPTPVSLIARGFIQNIKVFNDHLELDYRWSPYTKKIGLLHVVDCEQANDVSTNGAEDLDLIKGKLRFPDVELSAVAFF